MAIYPLWYFSDETDQEVGPFVSEAKAIEAQTLYAHSLSRELTKTETIRLKELYTELERN